MKKLGVALFVILSIIGCKNSEKQEPMLTGYSIQIAVDTSNFALNCAMDVDWNNSSDSLIYEIPFSFQLDSAHSLLKNVMVDNQQVDFKYATNDSCGFEGFVVQLSEPVEPHQTARIHLDFCTNPNTYFRDRMLLYSEVLPMVLYFNDGAFNPDYQVHADYRVNITFPEEFEIAASGIIEKSEIVGQNRAVVTAADAIPLYGFVLMKDIILEEDSASGVLIRSFYFEDDAKWGKKLLEHSKDIIAFYIDTLGFYPQPVLSIIPGYPKPYGGWPVCTNVVGIHRGIDLKKERAETHAHWIMSHEIGHQYWGFNYVLEPLNYPQWFGIGMGICTDRLYAQQNIPDFNHSKAFSGSYLSAMKKGYNTTIMQTVDTLNKQDFDWNNAIKHDKSFSVLQMLAYEIGENTFFEILKYGLQNYKGINVTLEMFKADCETISQRNLDAFFQTWFFTNDYLEYQIEAVNSVLNDGQYTSEIVVNRVGSATISHVEIEVILEGGEKSYTQFSGIEEQVTLQLTTPKPIESLVLDPRLKLLLVNREVWNKAI